ncbi:MAG: type II toxin-antitoxin system RelE/ParE family toxin [Calditrichia bacterium]|nr:type II toxin-antitoxin system RelE/ParE family toxin [Calditrichia bacterium]
MKQIRAHHDAEIELWHAVEYYESMRKGLGLDFESEFRNAIKIIQKAPERWPKKKYGTRYYLLKRFPFLIYYLKIDDTIWIVACSHMKRRPYYWRKRIEKD